MAYIIDSDLVIDHLGKVAAATELLASLPADPVYISIVSYMEVYQGTLRADDPSRALEDLENFVAEAPILPFDKAVAIRCASLREMLRSQGKRPSRRAFDLIIAATALEHDFTLITRNVRDYADIPNLRLYNLAI